MTRSHALIRETACLAIRLVLAPELGETPAHPLLGAPRRPPLPWLMPAATTPISKPQDRAMAVRFAPMTVADLDQREAVYRDLIRGCIDGIEVSLTPAGHAQAQRELAQVRRMRATAVVAGAR